MWADDSWWEIPGFTCKSESHSLECIPLLILYSHAVFKIVCKQYFTVYHCILQSRGKSLISSIAVTADDSYIYAADEDGYVYVHDIQNYALQDTKEETPKCTCTAFYLELEELI